MKNHHHTTVIGAISLFILASFTSVSAFSDGYILTGAYGGTTTILMDTAGNTVHSWDHSKLTNRSNGYSCYLLPNGNLLRTSQGRFSGTFAPSNFQPAQGAIDEVDSSSKLVWTYTLYNDSSMLHHDMKPLPNGNILAVSFYPIPKTRVEPLGIDPNLLKPGVNTLLGEKILELKPKYPSGADIVWEWSVFDHIAKKEEAAAHPELISGYIVPALWQNQWIHLNGIDYSPTTNLIVFSSRIFSELYVIERTETTELAKGHTGGTYGKGGDILYRWGNSKNYEISGGVTLEVLHSPTWIPEGYEGAGNIMFFHNNMTAIKSEVLEIKPPCDDNGNFVLETGKAFGPAEPTWKYAPESGLYSKVMSSAIRMPNGNTVVHEAFPTETWWEDGSHPQTDSRVREVNKKSEILWSDTLKIKGTMGFNPAKIMYYPSSYEGVCKLLGLPVVKNRENGDAAVSPLSLPRIRHTPESIIFSGVAGYTINIVTVQGKRLVTLESKNASMSIRTDQMGPGLFCVRLMKNNQCITSRTVNVVK